MFHLNRFVLHWVRCLLCYPANSVTYLQVVINHTILLFVIIIYIYFFVFHLLSVFKCSTQYPSPPTSWTVTKAVFPSRFFLEILPPPPSAGHEREFLIAVCGPDAFTHNTVR